MKTMGDADPSTTCAAVRICVVVGVVEIAKPVPVFAPPWWKRRSARCFVRPTASDDDDVHSASMRGRLVRIVVYLLRSGCGRVAQG